MQNPDLFVRVRMPNGDHRTVTRVAAERGGYKILDRPAVDAAGRPLLPKIRGPLVKPAFLEPLVIADPDIPEVPTEPLAEPGEVTPNPIDTGGGDVPDDDTEESQ